MSSLSSRRKCGEWVCVAGTEIDLPRTTSVACEGLEHLVSSQKVGHNTQAVKVTGEGTEWMSPCQRGLAGKSGEVVMVVVVVVEEETVGKIIMYDI